MDIYTYDSYKAYLLAALKERGARSALAESLHCHTTYVSQVLNGKTHFSLEHALQIAVFLSLKKDETDYFLLLIYRGKAGSKGLEDYYLDKIREAQSLKSTFENRVEIRQTLTDQDQAKYCSAWYFAAIHILLLIPDYRSIAAISEYLSLPADLVGQCLDFLVECGLAVRDGKDRFQPGPARMHLSRDSSFIVPQHVSWRMKTIHSLELRRKDDLHFSSVMSLSEPVFQKLRMMVTKFLESTEPVIESAKDEQIYFLGVDLFRV